MGSRRDLGHRPRGCFRGFRRDLGWWPHGNFDRRFKRDSGRFPRRAAFQGQPIPWTPRSLEESGVKACTFNKKQFQTPCPFFVRIGETFSMHACGVLPHLRHRGMLKAQPSNRQGHHSLSKARFEWVKSCISGRSITTLGTGALQGGQQAISKDPHCLICFKYRIQPIYDPG